MKEGVPTRSVVILSGDTGPLREAFNRDAEQTRLLLLLSPT